jgi:hypothetical protein
MWFTSKHPSVSDNKSNQNVCASLTGGNPSEIKDTKDILKTKNIFQPDGKYVVYRRGKSWKSARKRFLSRTSKSDVQIYDGLNYRHWDTWNEEQIQPCFLKKIRIVHWNWHPEGENFDSPKTFWWWRRLYLVDEQQNIYYVCKKKRVLNMLFLPTISLSTI